MADYINNVAAGDAYSDALIIGPNFDSKAAVITVANNPVLMQFAIGKLGNWRWTDEREFYSIPQSFRVGNIIGVKFRNANPGNVARVLAVLAGDDDPDFQSGTPFTGVLSSTGQVTPVSGAQYVNVAQFAALTPTDAMEVYLIVDAANGVDWHLRYNAGSASTFKWEFLGGSALRAEVLTHENGAAGNAYQDLATVGPQVTVQRGGDYEINFSCELAGADVGAQVYVAPKLGGLATADNDAAKGVVPAAGVVSVAAQIIRTLNANDVIKLQYRSAGASGAPTGELRRLAVRPVRLS